MLAKMTDAYGWETVWQSAPKTVKNNKELIGMLVISDGANVEVIQVWFNIMTGVAFVHNGSTFPASRLDEMMECVDNDLKVATENDEKQNAEKKSTDVGSVDVKEVTPVVEKTDEDGEKITETFDLELLKYFEKNWNNHRYCVIWGRRIIDEGFRYLFRTNDYSISVTPKKDKFTINDRTKDVIVTVCSREDVMIYINTRKL